MHPVDAGFRALAQASRDQWELEPLVVIPLIVSGALYAAGVAQLWGRAGRGQGLAGWRVASFAAGWLTTALALISPIAWLSDILFSVHMTQHTLLMLVAAPLLTFGQPALAWLWAFDARRRRSVSAACHGRGVSALWSFFSAPLAVFLIQALALWIWHVPALYQAALRSDAIHAVQHLCFILSGALFWWAMVNGRYGRMGYGLGVLYVFLTAVHSSVLGALLTVAPTPWYSYYQQRAGQWHVDALTDQQLAGLLMWIPAGVIFIVLGLALLAAWLGEAERRVRYGATDTASRIVGLLALAALVSSGCQTSTVTEAQALTGGDVSRGKGLVGRYGCVACHTIPQTRVAPATVGPPLDRIAARQYLGGHLQNSPANMVLWIQHPQTVDPRNAMPDLGVTDQDARDITAFLYTLR